MKKAIYLDYNATTPLADDVAKAMLPFIKNIFGNPSSAHEYGIEAKQAINKARRQVAELINAKPENIVFTSGGTESNNYAIKGIAFARKKLGNHIITSVVEHPAVMEVCRYLESKHAFEITYLPVNKLGLISLDELRNSIKPTTILITIMHANNEVGTIQPIAEIGKIAKSHGTVFHTDAAQSIGKIEVDVKNMNVDLLSIAGHKLYAPKGIGALYIRDGLILEKLMHGASHEFDRRAGTENILEIVGLGKAAYIAQRDLKSNYSHMKMMRDYLETEILSLCPEAIINGAIKSRLPNTLNISFPKLDFYDLIEFFVHVAASSGSACHSESDQISPVLSAIKLDPAFARNTIRFSTGRSTTKSEIDEVIKYAKAILIKR